MPETTYLSFEPLPHPNMELQDLLNEVTQKTGSRWFAVDRVCHVSGGWFSSGKISSYTELLKDINYGEYQVFSCVATQGEARAYLLGLLNNYKGGRL